MTERKERVGHKPRPDAPGCSDGRHEIGEDKSAHPPPMAAKPRLALGVRKKSPMMLMMFG
jgi:hypothetical protein